MLDPHTRRSRFALSVVTSAGVLIAIAARPAVAATITVTTLADSSAVDGAVSLREAILSIDSGTDYDADVTAERTGTYGIDDTINFSVNGTVALSATLPGISVAMTIDGTGRSVTISGGTSYEIMTVVNYVSATLSHLTLANGAGVEGGAIYSILGTVNIANSTFSGNSAGGVGGAIYNLEGTVNITNSTFSGNSATVDGGAIYSILGTVNIANSTFSGNSAPSGSAGAIYNDAGGTLSVSSCTFSGGSAASGGEIYNATSATLNVMNTLIDPASGLSSTLADNGGPTQTFALLAGSSAIDAVASGTCTYVSTGTNPLFTNGGTIATDQRGVSRPQGTLCDLGAYELAQNQLSVTVTGTGTVSAGVSPTPVSGSISSCSSSCSAYYDAEPPAPAVTLTAAIPVGDYVTWGGDCASAGNASSATATMSAEHACTAAFATLTATTTTITGANPNPVLTGNPVTIDFTVDPSPAGGTVTVTADDGTHCTATEPATNCSMTFSAPGDKALTAIYSGDATEARSTSSTFALTVDPPPEPIPTLDDKGLAVLALLLAGAGLLAGKKLSG